MSYHFYNPRIENQRLLRGFTLIESLVFLFLFAIISLTFFQTYAQSTRLIIDSKNRLGATALANQKMEIIRSIDYDDIGTKHWDGTAWTYGIPPGELLEDETVLVNTVKYEVHTFVQYVDDSFDGTVATGDTIPTDYKRVRITVSWGDLSADRSVGIFGNFSPRGVETAGGGGVLAINILDASGAGVPNANVHIVNASASVNVTATTDATGNIMFPGAPAGTENYVLTVSKNNYYGATTYPPYPTSAYNPVDVHASVVAGVLNQKTIVIDQFSDMTLMTQDPFGTVIPNIGYTLTGGRILGTNPVSGNTVLEFSDTAVTDASGVATYVDQSYGQYLITIAGTDYQFLKFSPESTLVNEFTATAGVNTNVSAILMDTRIGSVQVKVRNQTDGSPLAGASVQLSNATLLYDVTIVTDQYGYAYFPTTLPALLPGTYDIEVSLSGFSDVNDSVVVNGALEVEVVDMSP